MPPLPYLSQMLQQALAPQHITGDYKKTDISKANVNNNYF